jgi:hypothetical protein
MIGTPGKQQFAPMSPFRLMASPNILRRSSRVKTHSPSSASATRGLLLSPVKAPSTPMRPVPPTPSTHMPSPSATFSPTALFSIFATPGRHTPRHTPRRALPNPKLDDPALAATAAVTPGGNANSIAALLPSVLAPTPDARLVALEPDFVMQEAPGSAMGSAMASAPRAAGGRSIQIGLGSAMTKSDLAAINNRMNRDVRKVLFTPTKVASPAKLTPRRTPRRDKFCSPRTRLVMDALEGTYSAVPRKSSRLTWDFFSVSRSIERRRCGAETS